MELFVNPLFPIITAQRDSFLLSTEAALFDLELIHGYLSREAYWAIGRSQTSVLRSMQHSFCVGVYQAQENGRLPQVGFCRVNTDFAIHAYLADVFILPDYRGHGLGKWLIQTVQEMEPLKTVRLWQLNTKDAQGLYAQFGFAHNPEPEKHMVWRPEPKLA